MSFAEVLFENTVEGPESIAEYNGNFYSGAVGGSIVKWTTGDNKVTKVIETVTGKSCDTSKSHREQHLCGRPLGMRTDSKGNVYVLDAYIGIKKIDAKTGRMTDVFTVDPKQVIGSRVITFLDDVALDEGGGSKGGNVYYMTDSTKGLTLDLCFASVISAEKTGRIIKFDEDTQEVTVIYEPLSFPNGIELTDDRNSVIVSEISIRTLVKIGVKGSNKGKRTVLNDNLPGMADNVRRSSRKDKETYWLAFFQARTEKDILDNLRRTPYFLRGILRMTHNLGVLLNKLGDLAGCSCLNHIAYAFESQFILFEYILPKTQGVIAEVDANGNVLRTLWDPSQKFLYLSEVREVIEDNQKVLYLASFTNKYVGRLVLEGEHVTTTTTKSTTTTKTTTTTTTPKPTAKASTAPPTTTTQKPASPTASSKKKQDEEKIKEEL